MVVSTKCHLRNICCERHHSKMTDKKSRTRHESLDTYKEDPGISVCCCMILCVLAYVAWDLADARQVGSDDGSTDGSDDGSID